jgi:two-component system OmpR family sensor kinase/two-component system sensor histidine kinase QseC
MSSIRTRLLVTLLAVVLAAAAAGAVVTYRNVLQEAEALFDYQLRPMALSLRNQGFISAADAAALADDGLDFVVQIWSMDGTQIYLSRPTLVLPTQAVLGYSDVQVGTATWRMFTTVTRDRAIQVAQPLAVRRELAAGAALRGALPILALAPVLALAIWWTVGAALRSLQRVAAEVKQRGADALDPVPETALPREVGPLVHAFNTLLERLRRAIAAQRAFVSDAAHELRSPLTALTLQLQLLRRAATDTDREAAISALGGGIERAQHLVEQLLALARSEQGEKGATFERVDLAEAARLAVADVVPLAEAKGTDVTFDAPESVQVDGDASALRILVRNLVDNAVRYTPAGGKVQAALRRQAEGALLQVDDSGPGIAPAERARVFDRFYRGAGRDEGGSGLGLAIARGICERHRASIELADSALGGLQVRVRFGAPAVGRKVAGST